MRATDRFKAALEALVTRITGKYDYAIPYACKVVQQNSDGTLELVPDLSSVPGLSNVPIRYGSPGVKATVSPGSRVIVEFENADPSKPVVIGWDVTSPLIMLTFGNGTQPIARTGDLTQAGGPGQLIQISLTLPLPTPGFVAPPGSLITGFVSFGPTPPNPTGTTGDPLYGVITTGALNTQS